MPTRDEVRTQLASFGLKIDNFNQKEPDRASKDKRLTAGYCEGVTLDWIRRVVQGGRPSFSPKAVSVSNPEHLFLQKIQSQAARQAHAFLTWTPTKLDWQETRAPGIKKSYLDNWNKAKNEALDQLEALEDKIYEVLTAAKTSRVELTPEILAGLKNCLGINIGMTQNLSTVTKLYRDDIPDKIKAIKDNKIDPQQTLDKVREIARENAWNEFSAKSSALHKKPNKLPKKRSFENIALLSSQPMQYDLDLRSVLTQLMAVGNDLKSSSAVKINIGGQQASSQFFHSTAAYLDSGSKHSYLFLDPNYGIFAYTEWKMGVMKALAYLYTKVYNWVEGPPDIIVPITNYKIEVEMFGRKS